jgi:hypothetical protein
MATIIPILLRRSTGVSSIRLLRSTIRINLLRPDWLLVRVMTLLSHKNTTDSLVHGLKLRKIGGRDFDWIACNRKNDDILPRVKFVLIFHHLRSLPVILDASTLQRKLLHLHRHWASRLSLNHSNVIFRLQK